MTAKKWTKLKNARAERAKLLFLPTEASSTRIWIFLNPDLASTRLGIHIGLKNIHSGERIQKVADSPANSPDTCGRKAYPIRKSCKIKNIRIRLHEDLNMQICVVLIAVPVVLAKFPIGHFRVAACLGFEVSLGAQLL